MFLTIHLPVSKPIKKFLVAKFGEEYHPTQNEWFGILITSLLHKKSYGDFRQTKKTEELAETYKIGIRISFSEKHGIFLEKNHESLIQKAVENIFRDSIYEQAIMNKQYYGIDYKTSIENALDFYGIVEDAKSYYSTLIRDFTRKKEAIMERMDKI
jgi:hypothetical protein